MEERNKQISEVEAELAELVKRALAEGGAAGEAGRGDDEGTTPWTAQSASITLQAMASKPGIPPEFAALLDHVFRAAQALASATASARPTAGTTTAEGSESNGHRNDNHQQQQPRQQRQLQHPTTAAGPSDSQGAGAGTAATEGGSKGSLSGAAVGTLAPQGRWAKGANVGGENGGKHLQQQHQTEGDGMQVDETGPSTEQMATGGADVREESNEELVEEDSISSGIDDGVVESINKLPMADQKKLKAALGARGGRRRSEAAEGEHKEETFGGRDRERSPRPTKGGAGQGDQ